MSVDKEEKLWNRHKRYGVYGMVVIAIFSTIIYFFNKNDTIELKEKYANEEEGYIPIVVKYGESLDIDVKEYLEENTSDRKIDKVRTDICSTLEDHEYKDCIEDVKEIKDLPVGKHWLIFIYKDEFVSVPIIIEE